MPNAKVLSEKQAVVAQLSERLQAAQSGVFVDYKGITVLEDNTLRRDLTAKGIEYSVVKNTLTKFALKNVGIEGIDDALHGTTSLATSSEDPILPIRLISEQAKKMGDRFNVKAVFLEGKVLSEAEIAEIAELESKDALYSKVLGTMLAPITSLAVVLGQIVEQAGGTVETATEEAAEAAAE